MLDPQLKAAVQNEITRQKEGLELIASENYVSDAVREAQGSVLTNKYAEGYPGRRYYGGCEFVDVVENLALERLKTLFATDENPVFANVQPHSGSQANMAAYFSLINPGDKILGMNLAHGGHLTHGSPVNFSGRLYQIAAYGVREDTHLIDYDEVRAIAQREKPKMLIAGASAYPRVIDFKIMGEIAAEVGATFVVDMAHIAGLVATGLHPSPLPYADLVTSTTHKTLRGPRGGIILSRSEERMKKANSQIFPGIQGGPLMHVIAAKAQAFGEASLPAFKAYQSQVIANAKALAAALEAKGFSLVTGGTDNHLMLIDLRKSGLEDLTGKDAEKWLGLAHITVNKNAIPYDTRPPNITSGIRMGTPALTTRGLGREDMECVANWISQTLRSGGDAQKCAEIGAEVKVFAGAFPLFTMG